LFLQALIRRNPAFVAAAVTLHQEGRLPPNSYVLDLDIIEANARNITDAAHRAELAVWAMAKQFGRVRPALDAVVRGGADGFVAVDMACVRPIARAGHRVGHLGHLVQIPRAEANEAASVRPDYWTVFSDEKAHQASHASGHLGVDQKLLARIHAVGDTFYPGHEGGFPAEEIVAVAERIEALPHVRFAGVTSFPALVFDPSTRKVQTTPNLDTLARAAETLRSVGFGNVEVNAPGTTSTEVMRSLADAGATQVEPGHGFTGTTPLHAVEDLPELPAALYLTEVSHHVGDRAYCFGGGLYVDPVFPPYQVTALVGGSAAEALDRPPLPADLPSPASIDYYGQIQQPPGRAIRTGDTVVFGFRMQAFFTRALVVPLSGVGSGHAAIEGIWRTDGSRIDPGDALA
jgi:predicted amino acid racemase